MKEVFLIKNQYDSEAFYVLSDDISTIYRWTLNIHMAMRFDTYTEALKYLNDQKQNYPERMPLGFFQIEKFFIL